MAGLARYSSTPLYAAFVDLHADPDPALYLNADPDPASQTNADPGPGQTLPSRKVEFLYEKYTLYGKGTLL
jgi:hypothetical protein